MTRRTVLASPLAQTSTAADEVSDLLAELLMRLLHIYLEAQVGYVGVRFGPSVPCEEQYQAENLLEQLHDMCLFFPKEQGEREPVEERFVEVAQRVETVAVARFVAVQCFVDVCESLLEELPVSLDTVEEISTDCGDEVVALDSEDFGYRVCCPFHCRARFCVTV